MFESIAYAADAVEGASQVNPLVQFMPIILMFVIFYFLLIRPQQKKGRNFRP
jgi:preprotein translocase subunit YajC